MHRANGATRIPARIYAADTVGAFLGVLTAGYCLVPTLGLPASLRAVAVINLISAVVFSRFSRPEYSAAEAGNPSDRESSRSSDSSLRPFPVWVLYAVACLNGAAVMTLENVVIRITNLPLGSSSYSF